MYYNIGAHPNQEQIFMRAGHGNPEGLPRSKGFVQASQDVSMYFANLRSKRAPV